MATTAGYDAPQLKREDDFLDRWRFAAYLFTIVRVEWSVRIGVFAKWGEGKTTVLRFLEQMAVREQFIPVRFSPWSAHSWDDLWAEFAAVLVSALESHDAATKTVKKLKYKLLGKKVEKRVKPLVTDLANLSATAKASAGAGFALLQQFLDVDGSDFQALQSELNGRRVIVLIDDLDRADPRLVPQLLLALRELLDLPGFIFVLAFDDEIISKALTVYHTAWSGGEAFLEKIIDFRQPLPRATPAQVRKLFESSLKAFCPFIDLGVANEVADLLPLNPRKVKALIRHVSALKGEALRHDADELNWVDVLIAQLIRLESEGFFSAMLQSTRLEDMTFSAFAARRERSKSLGKEDHELQFDDLLQAGGVTEAATKERLQVLMDAQRGRGSLLFRSQAEFAMLPPLITWKEFRECMHAWSKHPEVKEVEAWVDGQVSRRSALREEIVAAFYDMLLKYRDGQLEAAADAQTLDAHETAARDTQLSLQLVRQLLLEKSGSVHSVLDSPVNFGRLFDQTMKWIHFFRNPVEPEVRAQERQVLVDILMAHLGADADAYLEVLRPWSMEVHFDVGAVDAESAAKGRELRAKLIGIVGPAVAENVLAAFRTPGGIRRLSENGKGLAERYIFFNLASPLWAGPLKERFYRTLTAAGESHVGSENCLALFELVLACLKSNLEAVDVENLKRLLRDEVFVQAMWAGAVSRRIQYRRQLEILEGRDVLIASGAAASALSVPDWLAERLPAQSSGKPAEARDVDAIE